MRLTIGSRGSQLALWQARYVAAQLERLGVETRIEIIKTTGDHLQTASLVQAGGKGLFTKEIEEALLNRVVDLAVHSLKDLPTESPADLEIAAVPEREDPRDALIGCTLERLPSGACIGTSSNRRAAQLKFLRPDLVCEPIRGNVDTRLRKLQEGQFEAVVLAAAGLRRLGLESQIAQRFTPEQMCPAPGQGALGIQTRRGDAAAEICRRLNHLDTEQCVACERAVLASLGGGCQLPVGAFACVQGDRIDLQAVAITPDGRDRIRMERSGDRSQFAALGEQVGFAMLEQGAGQLIIQGAS